MNSSIPNKAMTAPESSPKPAEAIAREITEKLACFFTTGLTIPFERQHFIVKAKADQIVPFVLEKLNTLTAAEKPEALTEETPRIPPSEETPRTENEVFYRNGCEECVDASFARQLERELNAAKEWNLTRAGQFACTEQRLATEIAVLKAALKSAGRDVRPQAIADFNAAVKVFECDSFSAIPVQPTAKPDAAGDLIKAATKYLHNCNCQTVEEDGDLVAAIEAAKHPAPSAAEEKS